MKISYNWLKEFVDIPEGPKELGSRFTNIGLAVDALESRADDSIFELDVASNRPDCLSHFGVAREVAAVYGSSAQAAAIRTCERMTNARTTCSPSRLRIRTFAPATADVTSRA